MSLGFGGYSAAHCPPLPYKGAELRASGTRERGTHCILPLHTEGKLAGSHVAVLGTWPVQMPAICLHLWTVLVFSQ